VGIVQRHSSPAQTARRVSQLVEILCVADRSAQDERPLPLSTELTLLALRSNNLAGRGGRDRAGILGFGRRCERGIGEHEASFCVAD
jgi:hypothetical protein